MEALARRAAAPAFILALFASAALIFVLQPLFARMVTPLLGGSPAVWNTSMAFFQSALLVGYVYAHALARLKNLHIQVAIHVAVLALAFLVLPVHVSSLFGPPNSEHPSLWLVGVLAASVGAPFAAASATAPLLQSWYARSGREDSGDPYYLYAASNLGSFIGLLAYPALIEPLLGAQDQSTAWTAGYIIVSALILVSAAIVITARGKPIELSEAGPAPTWPQRLFWMAAAAVPSALVLGVTLHISTDVASAPMLWVIPLALYLATFVIAFMRGGERWTPLVQVVQPLAVALLMISYTGNVNWPALLAGNLIGFFLSALVCHMALARTRPHAGRLTEFYFWVSLGGVAGGAFAAFLAPVIFNNVYEYPLALAAAALFVIRGVPAMPRLADVSIFSAAAMAALVLLLLILTPHHAVLVGGAIGAAAALIAAGWGDENRPQALRYAYLAVAAAAALLMTLAAFNVDTVFIETTRPDFIDSVAFASPWGGLIIAISLIALMFSAHAGIQPRRGERTSASIVSDAAVGVSIPMFILLISLGLLGEQLSSQLIVALGLGACAISLFLNRARPMFMSILVLTGFTIIFLDDGRSGRILRQERSFFGVLKTIEHGYGPDSDIPPLRVLMHGTTIHGAQLGGDFTRIPLTYYNRETALGESILAGMSMPEANSIALIGLGAGSTACLTRPEDHMVIFEIDPAVVRLSNSPLGALDGDFTFVPQCQPNARVELGDARLQIAEEPDSSFDVIVVDAFSSDAIPTHLLTQEALALYLRKTKPNGIVVLHLSNRNLALVSEAARVAASLGAPARWRVSDRVEMPLAPFYGGLAASVMIVAHAPETFTILPLQSDEWRAFAAPPGRPWSDDYVNLPRALWDSLSGAEECRTHPYLSHCSPGEEAD
jgi:spermidine synthase